MKRGFTLFGFFILCGLVLSLSACGKMSEPKPIENSGYPHIYPKI